LERRERPGGDLILLPIRLPAHLLQNPLLLGRRVPLRLASAMPLDQGINPVPVKPRDQVRDGIATLPPSGSGCCLKACTIGDREHFLGTRNLSGWISARSAHLFKGETFLGREGTKGIFLMTGHGTLQGRRNGEYLPSPYSPRPSIGNHQDK